MRSEITPEQYRGMVEYLETVSATVREVMVLLPDKDFDEVWMFVEHGEHGLGLSLAAWILANSNIPVPARLAEALYDLTEGLVDRSEMPDKFRTVEDEAQNP